MRFEDWPERMAEVIARHTDMPFAWGASDCFAFPIDVAMEITGSDPRQSSMVYDSAETAQQALRANGWRNAADAFASFFEPVHPSRAKRGDIGIADYPGAILGGGVVVIGTEIIGKAETGLLRLPRSKLIQTFKVGW